MGDSSLKSINAGTGSLGNAWAELLWARSRVAELLIQYNALSDAGNWIANVVPALKLYDSRKTQI